jgi:hypothetical protein
MREAKCSCGQLKAEVRGEPVRVSICHCLACQRRTGGVFSTQARYVEADVTLEGQSTTYTRVGDNGNHAVFHFCPTCGCTVFYRPAALPGFIIIPIGAFADPTFNTPTVSVYENRKHAWVVPPPNAEHFH